MQVPNTKGTLKCCIGRNPYNGYKYLCGASAASLYLMQWYDPLNKFMLLKVCMRFVFYGFVMLFYPARIFHIKMSVFTIVDNLNSEG